MMVIAGWASSARADESLHATVTTSGGWTDNILSASAAGDPNAPPVESDAFTQISPGLVFSQETRRLIHVASYNFSANLFAGHSEANSFSNRLGWQSIYAMSPLSELSLSAGAANGRINTFNTVVPVDAVDFEPLPAGGTTYVSANAQESYRRELSRAWRLQQASSIRVFKPLDDAANQGTNYYLANGFGLERGWQFDSLATTLRLDYSVNGGGTAPSGEEFSSDQQILVGPEARYLHDFGERLSGQVDAGVLAVVRADDFKRGLIQPTGSLALRWVDELGRAELMYRHGVQPNIFVAQTSATDAVQLRAGIPVPWVERASLGASIGYQRGRVLDLEAQALEGTSELWVADVGAAWRPRAELTLALRYQRYQQSRDMAAPGTLVGYDRNQVVFSLTARYPGRQAAVIPFRSGARVDRSDERGFGDSPDPNDVSAGSDRR
ncbi:MAG TPA: hypothetical protein VML75_06275 [Kofleriaceae bacterium]|nr:hypothetical protein [Kofleriaceae bacterium]